MKRTNRNRITTLVITLLISAVAVVGCGNQSAANDSEVLDSAPANETALQKPSGDNFILKGKVSNGAGELIVLQKLEGGQLTFIDSVRADEKGKYKIEAHADTTMFYYVTVNSLKPPGVPVILENGLALELNLEIDQFILTEVKGDKQNEQLKSLYDIYLTNNKASYDFQQQYKNINPREAGDSTIKAYNTQIMALQRKMDTDISNFVSTQKGGPATFFAVTYVVQKPNVALLDNAMKRLKADAPNTLFTDRLEQRIASIGALEIGGLAPEIELLSPSGEKIKLSSLRGKVVLVDFWASWCRPCRAENPNVVKVYNRYHDQGFEVFSVSLDNSADRWKQAIIQDNLTWTHVSDLKGWKSSAAALYEVSGIPKTFLLDKEGRIIGKDLRGPALELKLSELFN
ncbi:MAG: AhpC/TSA family protein [Bacteroidetes bacterium]|jgi:peroxiredoxin|nr:AhpC/TSA family protein [Bacteroidota bacterium]